MTTIIDTLVPEQLWQAIQPLLPTPPPRYGGHPASTTMPAWPPPYVAERSLAWLVGCWRLQVRYERRAHIRLGLLHLACALMCLKVQSPSEA